MFIEDREHQKLKQLRMRVMKEDVFNTLIESVNSVFIAISKYILDSEIPKDYEPVYIVPFENNTPEYVAILMLREQYRDANRTVCHILKEFTNKYGFKSVDPLSNERNYGYIQLEKQYPNGFEAVRIELDLKNMRLSKSLFGEWQSETIDRIEKHLKAVQRREKIEREAYLIKSIIENTAEKMITEKEYKISEKKL